MHHFKNKLYRIENNIRKFSLTWKTNEVLEFCLLLIIYDNAVFMNIIYNSTITNTVNVHNGEAISNKFNA